MTDSTIRNLPSQVLSARAAAHQHDGGYNDDGYQAKLADWIATFVGAAEQITDTDTAQEWSTLMFWRTDHRTDLRTFDRSFPRTFADPNLPQRDVNADGTLKVWPLVLPDEQDQPTYVLVLTDTETKEDRYTREVRERWVPTHVWILPNEEALVDVMRDLPRPPKPTAAEIRNPDLMLDRSVARNSAARLLRPPKF